LFAETLRFSRRGQGTFFYSKKKYQKKAALIHYPFGFLNSDNPSAIKRPVLENSKVLLVGFKGDEYKTLL